MKLTAKEYRISKNLGSLESMLYQNYTLFYQEEPNIEDENIYLKIHMMHYLFDEYGIGRDVYDNWELAKYNDSIVAPCNKKLQQVSENMLERITKLTEDELNVVKNIGTPSRRPDKIVMMELGNMCSNFAKSRKKDISETLTDTVNYLYTRSNNKVLNFSFKEDVLNKLKENNMYTDSKEEYFNSIINFIRGGLHLSYRYKYNVSSDKIAKAWDYLIEKRLVYNDFDNNDYSQVVNSDCKVKRK